MLRQEGHDQSTAGPGKGEGAMHCEGRGRIACLRRQVKR